MSFFDDIGRHGDATALVTEADERITYAGLASAADAVGGPLRERRLAFLLADNCPESVIGYLGFLRARVPTALLASSLPAELLASLLAHYRPGYVWLPEDRVAEIPGARREGALGKYALVSTSASPVELHPDLALLVTTSGSTGSPRFVRQSRANVESNAEAIARCLGLDARARPITTLPMHYVYGLSVINSHLARGATLVLTNRTLAEMPFWDLLRRERATSMAGVPFTYELLRRLRFGRMDLPDLKVLTQAGGKLDPAVVKEFAELCQAKGMRFYVMYGASEATARMTYLPAERVLEKPGSVGIAIPGGDLWLEDDQGGLITAPDVVGELVYKGENVTMGYAERREDLALGDERGGVLRTGDLARRDEEGFYFIVGRKSRFLKIFGNRVNLEELEQLIRKRGVDCACAGEDDALRIYITEAARAAETTAFVQELTRLHHSAYRIVVVDQIPRTEAGKIRYGALP
jgi:acyl-CoA synthetase (AMP-forming)/AMP-acid ligase II